MASSRFFIANLPTNTKEQDLVRLFQDYGEIAKVELKTKENLVDPENVKILAFVTLKIGEEDAEYCLNELNWQKVNGAKITVSLAKESFLERLKRERQEAEEANSTTEKSFKDENQSALLAQNLKNTRKTFSEDVELDEDDIAPELLITKKRAASSLQNGKIVIQKNYEVEPIHVIETKKATKQLDEKSSSADQKRKESMHKKKNQYQQNKLAIQQSLAGLDGSSAKKIKFSDAEEEDEVPMETGQPKPQLFGSDDEDDGTAVGLNLKAEHYGKKGERLLELKSKQSLDPRFKIDAKFLDEADEDDDDDDQRNELETFEVAQTEGNERDWQMKLLEQVTGTKVDTGNTAEKAARNKKMLRFDPSKDEHKKFIISKKEQEKEKSTKKQAKKSAAQTSDDINNDEEAGEAPEVSKEVFYVVTDTLTQSLKTRGDGFSLLNMFGKSNALEEQREQQLKQLSNERILVNKTDKHNALNPFSYESSTDTDDEEAINAASSAQTTEKPEKSAKPAKKVKVHVETFFIPKNDVRLKEGAKFFKFTKDEGTAENYEEVRNRLKMLIRTKITKTKKHLVGASQKRHNKVK